MSVVGAPDGGATRRLDHTMAVAVGASRVFAAAQTVAAGRALRRRVRHPRVLESGVALLIAQSVWAGERGWRRRSIRDRAIAVSDGVAQCVALVIEAASWGSRSLPSDLRWSETFGAVVTSWMAFADPSPAVAFGSLGGWLATYVATTGGGDEGGARGQRLNEATGHVAFTMVGRVLGRQLTGQATELDVARAEAVTQAERLATEQERHRQQRIVHDSALQVLEAVAGGWELDDALLLRRIDYETERLRRLIDGASRPVDDLAGELTALVDEFGAAGLEVHLDMAALTDGLPPASIEAVTDAAYEALTNVHKHAGVERATVCATTGAGGTEVSIVDDGRGFDTGQPRSGFGVSESIEGRMRDAGGTATVSSRPGSGTCVRLWVPG